MHPLNSQAYMQTHTLTVVQLAWARGRVGWSSPPPRKRFCYVRITLEYDDLATERERQLTTARANQTTGLTNGRAANWAPEVVFSPFRALSCRQLTFP